MNFAPDAPQGANTAFDMASPHIRPIPRDKAGFDNLLSLPPVDLGDPDPSPIPSSRRVRLRFREMAELLRDDSGAGFSLPHLSGPVWTAKRLSGLTTFLLPGAHRKDKAEEFASELHDLAEAGCSRRAQLAHSFRLLVSAPSLRRELLATDRATERG